MRIAGIVLLILMYPFVLLMYFLMKNEGMNQKKGRFCVTLSKQQQAEPEVEQISAEYCRQMKQILWMMLLAPLLMFLSTRFSIMMTIWLIWVLVSCFIFLVPYGIANTKLKELKLEKGWKQQEQQPIYTEMKEAGKIRRVRWFHFLPQSIISIVMLGVGIVWFGKKDMPAALIMLGSFAIVTILFWLAAVWMDKQKTQIISSDSDINVNYGRAQKNLWKNLWVSCAWINIGYMASLFVAFEADGNLSAIFWISFVLYNIALVAVLVVTLQKKQALEKRYRDKMDITLMNDDDNWIWGMMYYNPRDKHFMVEKRVGVGTTVNMATSGGKIFTVVVGSALLWPVVFMMYLIAADFTPIHLQVEDRTLVVEHMKEEYTIYVDSIQNVELLTELPKLRKNYGTNMENLYKGSFRVKEEGSCEVLLNPQNTVFIKLSASGEVFYFSGADDEETRAVYELIK